MIRHVRTASLAALAALAAGCATVDDGMETPVYERPEWTDLLADGLDGFTIRGEANWSYADGVVAADAGPATSFLITNDAYGDFELSMDFYVSEEHNSGVFFRCDDIATIVDTLCYEANIYDNRPDQSGRTGGIPNYLPPMVSLNSGGKWNSYVIRAEGDAIMITLNGVTTVEGRNDAHGAASPIAFQWGTGTVKFRNMKVRPL